MSHLAEGRNSSPSNHASISDDRYLIVEKPVWDRRSGELTWRNRLVLMLTDHAVVESALLDAWQRLGWKWVICDPLDREALGDPTLARRHALHRLNKNQVGTPAIYFGSLRGGLICWYPSEWE